MSTKMLVAPFRRLAIFAGLRPLQITEIARRAERVRFQPGSTLTAAGTSGDCAYLIASGAAVSLPDQGRPEDGRPIAPGSLVGEMAMLVEHEYRETVVARERVLCLRITREALHEQMLEDPALARHFERHLRSRLARVVEDLREIDDMLVAAGGVTPSSDACEPKAAAAGSD